ncbi:MAG: thiol oxidoreductase, partial [Candidatus Eisenbacteria bacterium]|nr:thiol oxidoreductase [Candidatus Eisenbacteria bacterium]
GHAHSEEPAEEPPVAPAEEPGEPEVTEANLTALVEYCRALAVPARRDVEVPAVRAGAQIFEHIGCARCHVPTLTTGPDGPVETANETIHPFTDLLLHDLGPGMASIPDGPAAAGEWRTAPLWGLGLAEAVNGYRFLLHDGRARSREEAILWHGGEADRVRDEFRRLSSEERVRLLAFLESL